MKSSTAKSGISRRKLLAASGLAGIAAAIGVGWPRNWGPLVEGDLTANSEFDVFDRGLVPIAKSGWTIPEGVQEDYPTLNEDIKTDIAVIGAGLAGTSLALHLSKAGINVTILEAQTPGWGASGRNAGHVLPILKDMSVFESFPDGGKRFLEAFREHHTIPFDLSKEYDIECDAVKSGYLNAMTSKSAFQDFESKNDHLEKMGLPKPVPVSSSEMVGMTGTNYWSHGLVYPNGGRVNSYLLSNGLAKAAMSNGAKVFANSPAISFEPDGNRWKVRTETGNVTADRIVFCTNAYPGKIAPDFTKNFYPLTAYGLTTQSLPDDIAKAIMPGGQTLAQVPIDLNPLVKDRHNRLVLSSIPSVASPENAKWHFENQMKWLRRVWPEIGETKIQLQTYWTGRVAMRDKEFPGVFELEPGVYGLMHFNAWGNIMAPLMGKLLAEGLASGDMKTLPFPIEKPQPVGNIGKQDRIIRQWMIPAARQAQRWGVL